MNKKKLSNSGGGGGYSGGNTFGIVSNGEGGTSFISQTRSESMRQIWKLTQFPLYIQTLMNIFPYLNRCSGFIIHL